MRGQQDSPAGPSGSAGVRALRLEAGVAENDEAFTPGDWSLFVSVAMIWGSSFLLIDIGLDAFPPGLVTLIRVGAGAMALWLLLQRRRNDHPSIRPEDRGRIVLLSFMWVAVPFTCFPLAQGGINSSVTGLLNGATPIFASLFAALFFRQIPRGALAVGIGVGFTGITLIS
ncbi:MAG: DMT family transporter, partial [Actinomycetota bacterium]